MTKVTLKILASDIRNTQYANAKDCAITRALHRAGYPHLKDCGTDIFDTITNKEVISADDSIEYNNLMNRVINMYYMDEEPKDFQVTLELDL